VVADGGRPPDDVGLVREVAAGSSDALAILYDRHADAVYASACRLTSDRHVAEEVVQETFLALWNRAELFDPTAGSLAAWLYTIARNRTVDRLRAAGRRPSLIPLSSAASGDEQDTQTLERLLSTGTVVGAAIGALGPEGTVEARELRRTLRDALATMPELERTVIVLAYHEDLTQSEIAERLGWPIGTVKTRTRRGLMRLRQVLAETLGPEAGLGLVPVPAGEDT
jgi:RNA polymerase sigma-70 factor (ECF subfamily)